MHPGRRNCRVHRDRCAIQPGAHNRYVHNSDCRTANTRLYSVGLGGLHTLTYFSLTYY